MQSGMHVKRWAMKNCFMADVKIVASRSNPSKARKRKDSALTDAGGTGGTITTRTNDCINMGNEYPHNHLTNPWTRVIYGNDQGGWCHGENYNQDRCNTKT